jgi:hypothetical protein
MKGDRREPRCGGTALETLRDRLRMQRLAVLAREHQTAISPCLAPSQPFLELALSVCSQFGHGRIVEFDCARTTGLRLAFYNLVADSNSVSAHGQHAAFKVEVGPAQTGKFSSTHSGHERDDPKGALSVLLDVIEERTDLLGRPHRPFHIDSHMWCRVGCRVRAELVAAHGIAEPAA